MSNNLEPYRCPHPVKHQIRFQIEDFKPFKIQCGICAKDITHLVLTPETWVSEGSENEN